MDKLTPRLITVNMQGSKKKIEMLTNSWIFVPMAWTWKIKCRYSSLWKKYHYIYVFRILKHDLLTYLVQTDHLPCHNLYFDHNCILHCKTHHSVQIHQTFWKTKWKRNMYKSFTTHTGWTAFDRSTSDNFQNIYSMDRDVHNSK